MWKIQIKSCDLKLPRSYEKLVYEILELPLQMTFGSFGSFSEPGMPKQLHVIPVITTDIDAGTLEKEGWQSKVTVLVENLIFVLVLF